MSDIRVGSMLKDKFNEYVVVSFGKSNYTTHSQVPRDILVECVSGPNKGKVRWILTETAETYLVKDLEK